MIKYRGIESLDPGLLVPRAMYREIHTASPSLPHLPYVLSPWLQPLKLKYLPEVIRHVHGGNEQRPLLKSTRMCRLLMSLKVSVGVSSKGREWGVIYAPKCRLLRLISRSGGVGHESCCRLSRSVADARDSSCERPDTALTAYLSPTVSSSSPSSAANRFICLSHLVTFHR